jgi:hypothetical protein
MKTNFLTPITASVLLLLTGCETDRITPQDATRHRDVTPLTASKKQSNEEEILSIAAAQPNTPVEGPDWRTLFDGKSMAGWRITEFDEGGKVALTNGLLVLTKGQPFVGVNYTNQTPKVNYEVTLEAMRVSGYDFFCGLTFPVQDTFCSLIVGGWGGSLVGLSNLDGSDASENETTQFINFDNGKWYRIRLRVTERKIQAWIEQKQVVDVLTTGRKIELRFGEIEMSKPFGLSAWSTSAAYRQIKIRNVTGPEETRK